MENVKMQPRTDQEIIDFLSHRIRELENSIEVRNQVIGVLLFILGAGFFFLNMA
jgi:hypothetical protein